MGQIFSSCTPLFFSLFRLPLTTIEDLPDECLTQVFHFLHKTTDRNNCSLVCRRWLLIDSLSRDHLTLNAGSSQLIPSFQSTFDRFPNISQLSLKIPEECNTIVDQALVDVSHGCPNLSALTVEVSRNFSLVNLRVPCRVESTLSSRCSVGLAGIFSLVYGCSTLESLSIKGPILVTSSENFSSTNANPISHLKHLHLEGVTNARALLHLIVNSKSLKSLALVHCPGNWNQAVEIISLGVPRLVCLHLERLKFSDRGLSSVARFQQLEVLRLVKTSTCSESAFVQLTTICTGLKKVWIDKLSSQRDDENNHSLNGLGMNCHALEKLVTGSMHVSRRNLLVLGDGCLELESLSFREYTIRDEELGVVGSNFKNLKKITVKGCSVTDVGIMALCNGCPKLVKVKIKNCEEVSKKYMERFVERRGGVVVEKFSKKHFQKMCLWTLLPIITT